MVGETTSPSNKAGRFSCLYCKKSYCFNRSLICHLRKAHGLWDKACQVNIKKVKEYQHQCSKCTNRFNLERHLRFHMRREHGEDIPLQRSSLRVCPLCEETVVNAVEHYRDSHDIVIDSEEWSFSNFDEFSDWKQNLEFYSDTRFVKKCRSNVTDTHIMHYYVCHRSGHYVSAGKGKRRLKVQGSSRINGFCPAKIAAMEYRESKEVVVKFVKTHVGHDADLKHVTLSCKERKAIIENLTAKKSFDFILSQREGLIPSVDTKKIHLLTKKDLFNIKYRLNRINNDTDESSVDDPISSEEVKLDVLKEKEHCISSDEVMEESPQQCVEPIVLPKVSATDIIPNGTRSKSDELADCKPVISGELRYILRPIDTVRPLLFSENEQLQCIIAIPTAVTKPTDNIIVQHVLTAAPSVINQQSEGITTMPIEILDSNDSKIEETPILKSVLSLKKQQSPCEPTVVTIKDKINGDDQSVKLRRSVRNNKRNSKCPCGGC